MITYQKWLRSKSLGIIPHIILWNPIENGCNQIYYCSKLTLSVLEITFCLFVKDMQQIARNHPCFHNIIWWRHQMETFSILLALCAGNAPVTGEFPSQRPVMWSFDVFFDLCLNKQFSKQSRRWWFEMPLRSLWCPCNDHFESSQKLILSGCISWVSDNCHNLYTFNSEWPKTSSVISK